MKDSKDKMHVMWVDDGVNYGLNAAMILANIRFWLREKKTHKGSHKDGRVWYYNSRSGLAKLHPYLTERQIRTALQKLIDAGVIITGNYNRMGNDNTLWYSINEPEFILNSPDFEVRGTSSGLTHKSNQSDSEVSQPDSEVQPLPIYTTIDTSIEDNTLSNTREEEREIQDILDTWNQLYGCNLRMSKKRHSHIKARLKSWGAEKIKTAMENRLSNRYWNSPKGRPHRNNFDSFIRNDDQVDNYFNQEVSHTYTSKEELPF